ncbi:Hsp70 family protein [Plasticicumulans acidivorans]|uniref:Hsp70 protein n=1 Tax=Plasticicumulans acidivorans TaxID=886464 RepID=A0A317MX36_9GAMM|nr:Hsp70 family protein [Plasticicumulans acidivorans]PWV59529.1 Hsp70 protein [Plasticicumulans acidivorans]
MSRYLVGIDLGTTHTLVACADTLAATPEIELFALEQLVAPGEVAARPLLASMRYHPAAGELNAADLGLPWAAWDGSAVIGELARELGAKVPGRLVTSAKSWLSHPGVDRTAPILPWGADASVARISPLDASASYLAYVRAAWDYHHPQAPLAAQEIVLTLPASFDEGARLLTVEAARRAGLPQVRLLEEPQAACYDWTARHAEQLVAALADVHLLLVVDVGGGTTDLTLIRVEHDDDAPRLTRVAVGEHLMLGGDNMDLMLAHVAERRLLADGERLGAGQLAQLIQQCRNAKERLLAAEAPEAARVTLLGGGSRLIGAARSVSFSRDEVREWLVEGFLPVCAADDRPSGRRAALVEFGLPYAADAAITRHIAAFLGRHQVAARAALGDAADDGLALPDGLLLNGGVFHAHALSARLLDVLAQWRGGEPPRRLANADPDLAVARGAVAAALARRGTGVRIGGGSARSYCLLLDAEGEQRQAVCVLPRGSEEGQELALAGRSFRLRLGEPVHFSLVASAEDQPRAAGELLVPDIALYSPLPPVATVLDGHGEAQVQLVASLSTVGTLALACAELGGAERRWNLEFQLRGEGAEALPAQAQHPRFDEAADRILRFYGGRAKDVNPKEIKSLRADLEKLLGAREHWDTPLLRELGGVLWEGARRRRRSADHERLWCSLIGYALRPGFGHALDDWRVAQLWTLFPQGVQYAGDAQVVAEWWTLWRRVAGGLGEAAQCALLDAIEPDLPALAKGSKAKPGTDDRIRLAGALERVPAARKVAVGETLLARLGHKGESNQTWWALGRLGARVPFHGSAHAVVPVEVAERWCAAALAVDWKAAPPAALAATLLARLSGDRARDIDAGLRAQVAEQLRATKQPENWARLVEAVVELDEADRKRVFGEALPPGLRLAD